MEETKILKKEEGRRNSHEFSNKNIVVGKDFIKLRESGVKLGATDIDYSKRKNNKYFVALENGKKYTLVRQSTRIIFKTQR